MSSEEVGDVLNSRMNSMKCSGRERDRSAISINQCSTESKALLTSKDAIHSSLGGESGPGEWASSRARASWSRGELTLEKGTKPCCKGSLRASGWRRRMFFSR